MHAWSVRFSSVCLARRNLDLRLYWWLLSCSTLAVLINFCAVGLWAINESLLVVAKIFAMNDLGRIITTDQMCSSSLGLLWLTSALVWEQMRLIRWSTALRSFHSMLSITAGASVNDISVAQVDHGCTIRCHELINIVASILSCRWWETAWSSASVLFLAIFATINLRS